jgi:hypothetical protein
MFDFDTYMLQAATELNEIAHVPGNEKMQRFFRASSTVNVEGVLQNLSANTSNSMSMVVEVNDEGRLVESRSGATFYRQVFAFYLLKKCDINNITSRAIVKNQLFMAYHKILSRYRRDYKTDQELKTQYGLFTLDFNSFSYFTFGPVFDNMLGLHCSFYLETHVSLSYNPDNWQAVPTIDPETLAQEQTPATISVIPGTASITLSDTSNFNLAHVFVTIQYGSSYVAVVLVVDNQGNIITETPSHKVDGFEYSFTASSLNHILSIILIVTQAPVSTVSFTAKLIEV